MYSSHQIELIVFKSVSEETTELLSEIKAQHICEITDRGQKLNIRTMAYSDLENVRTNWTRLEGWSAMRGALAVTYKIDPQGFYLLEKNNEKIASISIVSYPDMKFSFIAFFVVPQALRGLGYGGLLLNKTVEYSQKQRGITSFGLNCLESMSPMYKKWGFETKYIDTIWKFTAKSAVNFTNNDLKQNIVSILDQDLMHKLIAYDKAVFGTNRSAYLQNNINKVTTTTSIYKQDGNIRGYGIISLREPANPEPYTSYRIGPVYADDMDIAKNIVDSLLVTVNLQANEYVVLETPGNNKAATELAKDLNFEKVIDMHKMYKGEEPSHDASRIFCYSSLVTGG